MNIRPGQSRMRPRTKKASDNTGGGVDALCSLTARVLSAAMVILVLAAFFHTYIKLDQDINSVKEEISKTENNIAAMRRDIETQDIRLAAYSTREYIERQIAHFNLPLVELRQDQQIKVKVYSDAQIARIYMPRRSVKPEVALDRNSNRNYDRRSFK